MTEQLSMVDILEDKKPEAPIEPAEPAPAAEPEAAARAEADEQRKEDYKSRRNKARDKEAIAQGKVRDPDTGQFVSLKADPAAATPAAPAPDPKAAEAAKAEAPKPAAAPQQDLTDKEKAFLRAVQEERGKRQELERRLAALESGKTQPSPPAEAPKTFWDDPEARLAAHRQEIEQVGINTRLHTAEMIARSRHPDFQDKVTVFQDFLAKATPPQQAALVNHWMGSPDPAEYAYNFGKNHIELQQVGSLDALRD